MEYALTDICNKCGRVYGDHKGYGLNCPEGVETPVFNYKEETFEPLPPPEAVEFAEWMAITGWKPWIEQGRVKYWHHTDLLKGAWSTKDKYKEYLKTK